MLEQMRSMAKSPVAVVLIGLLILSFAVWGISDVFRGGQGDAVVIVGPNKISVQDYAVAWDRELSRILRDSEGKITSKQARDFGLAEQLLQRMINDAALQAKAKQLGIGTSNRLVAQKVREIEAFNDPFTGKFGEEQYRSILANARYTPEQFEREMRGELLREQITNPVVSGVIAPLFMVRTILQFQNEQRRVIEIILPDTIVADPKDPTEEELLAFLSEHNAAFQTPELRAATLVTISAMDLASEIDVPEDKIEELYAFRKSELSEPETRSWIQISTTDEATAKLVVERLNNGETAEDIAAFFNLAAPLIFEDTALTNTPDEQIAQALFAAALAETGISEGKLAWAAWKVSAITPAIEKSLEEVRETLREEFIKEEAADQLYELVGNFEDARASGATLEEAAESANLLLLGLPPIDQFGRNSKNQAISSLAGEIEILKTIFETEEDVESEILETGDGDYYAVRTDAIEAPKMPVLEDIREALTQAWKIKQRADAIKAIAEKIEIALKAGEDANLIAERHPGARVEIAILQRDLSVAPLTPRHASQLFGFVAGDVATAPDQTGSNLVVARLDEIIPTGPLADALIELRRPAVSNALAADLQTAFFQGLLQQYTIRQDQRLKALALGDNPDG